MSTFDSTKLPLRKLLEDIRDGKIQLPDFQRGWIWDDNHIQSLLVSIARSFPVGAVMLLETGGDVNFRVRPIENVEFSGSDPNPDELILDGQQRLTSLTQALVLDDAVRTRNAQGRPIKRHYYIDIEAALQDDRLEDAFIAVPEDRKIRDNFDRDIIKDLSKVELEVKELYFPCSQVLNSDSWETALHEHNNARYSEYMEFRSKVLSKFRDYYVPVIRLGKATSKEAVCTVFEKVNTGGVQLSVFDLVTASFAVDDFSLRDDWFGRDDGDNCRLAMFSKQPVLTSVKPEDFLQVVSILHTSERRAKDREMGKKGKQVAAVSCKRAAILDLSVDSYKKLADNATRGFLEAAKFLRNQCFFEEKEIPYRTQIVSLAAVLASIGDRWREPVILDQLSQWFWCGIFGELYGGAVETRIANDFEDLTAWVSSVKETSKGTDNESQAIRTIGSAAFQESRLDTLRTRQSAAYKGLSVLVVREGAKDFFYKDTIQSLAREESPIDIHHIFPRDWCKKNGISQDSCNSVVNKTMISSKANRKIGGNAPSRYLDALQAMPQVSLSNDAMDEILTSHNISPSALREDSFNSFYTSRKNQLIELIERAMGKSVQRDQSGS